MIEIFLWSLAIIISAYLIYKNCFKLSPQEEVLDRILVSKQKEEILKKPNLDLYLKNTEPSYKSRHFNTALNEVKKERAKQEKLEPLYDKEWFKSVSYTSSSSDCSSSSSSSDSGGSSDSSSGCGSD